MTGNTDQPGAVLPKKLRELSGVARTAKTLCDAGRRVAKTAGEGRNVTLFAAEDLQAARRAAEKLAGIDLAGLCGEAKAALDHLDAVGRESAEREAMRLLARLHERLRDDGRALTGHYPEAICEVITLAFDLTSKGMGVTLYYGPRLEKLGAIAGAEVDTVHAAVADALKDLRESLIPDDEFLALLRRACSLSGVIRDGRPATGPEPILEVLSALSFLRQSASFHRNPVRSAFDSYGQTRFSFQLFKLAARRHEDLELALGIATRDDVKRKASLWVPRNLKGAGNHYSTLEFRRAG